MPRNNCVRSGGVMCGVRCRPWAQLHPFPTPALCPGFHSLWAVLRFGSPFAGGGGRRGTPGGCSHVPAGQEGRSPISISSLGDCVVTTVIMCPATLWNEAGRGHEMS